MVIWYLRNLEFNLQKLYFCVQYRFCESIDFWPWVGITNKLQTLRFLRNFPKHDAYTLNYLRNRSPLWSFFFLFFLLADHRYDVMQSSFSFSFIFFIISVVTIFLKYMFYRCALKDLSLLHKLICIVYLLKYLTTTLP